MDELYDHFTNISIEKYGEKSFVFLSCGSFYEVYSRERDSKVMEICDKILNISVVKRNNTNKKGYYIAGIPCHSIDKFTKVLLNNQLTVILVDDKVKGNVSSKKTKEISKVYSPSCKILDSGDNEYYMEDDESTLCSIFYFFSEEDTNLSIAFINNSNGNLRVIPGFDGNKDVLFDKCSEIINTNMCVSEILLNIVYKDIDLDGRIEIENLKSKLGIRGILTHIKEYEYKDVKNTFLDAELYQRIQMEKYFKRHKTIYQDIFNNIGVQKGKDIGNLILMLDFLKLHGESFIQDLDLPVTLQLSSDKEEKYLKCYNGVYEKMRIFSKDKNKHSIFEDLNRTKTVGGKRLLSNYLQYPITCPVKLNMRYDSVDTILKNEKLYESLKTNLKICDLERYKRKLTTGLLKPTELPRIYASNDKITNIYETFSKYFRDDNSFKCELPDKEIWNNFIEYRECLNQTFNIDNCNIFSKKINGSYIGKNIFNEGIYEELDKKFIEHENLFSELENICVQLSKSIELTTKQNSKARTKSNINGMVSVSRTEKGGLSLSVTKTRCKNICKELLERHDIHVDNSKSQSNLKSKFIHDTSEKIIELEELLGKEVDRLMILKQKEISKKYSRSFGEIIGWINRMDVIYSFSELAKEFNLIKPEIIENDINESYVSTKGLRNLLVEKILEKQGRRYVSNDISISPDSSILLFGTNSSGKSTNLRACVQNIILAQIGCYVAAEEFKYSPYHKIFVRLGNNDDEFNSMSSFTKECSEINQIAENCCKKSFVAADEVCSTSETASSVVIVSTLLEILAIKRASFLCATHFFQLLEQPSINDMPCLRICHLKVNVTEDNILIFDRKLSEGCGNKNYGCLVAKKVIKNKMFLSRLKRNMNLIQHDKIKIEEKKIKTIKKSKYNKNIIVDSCQICGYSPVNKRDMPLDVHHIKFQMDFKCGDYLGDLKKDQASNLLVCCKSCHQDIHKGIINVEGYIESENGNNLKFEIKKNQ